MGKIYEKNLNFLSINFPLLVKRIIPSERIKDITYCTKPHQNILYRGKPFHSIADPDREAKNLLKDIKIKKGNMIIFFGIGTGRHIEGFSRRFGLEARDATFIVVEHSLEAFSLILHHRDISFLKGMQLFVGEDLTTIQRFIESLDPLSFSGYRIIELRGNVDVFKSYYKEIAGYFKNVMTGKLSDLLTRFAFENLWIKNIIDNVGLLAGRRSIRALQKTLSGRPVMVISAGPSLFQQLETIKVLEPWIYFIVVDTALEPLLRYGIHPDFVITLDAGFFNFYDFNYIFSDKKGYTDCLLIADMVVYPLILKNWGGEIFFSETASTALREGSALIERHPLQNEFSIFYPFLDYLKCGGSVSTTALEFAFYAGASPVFITGLDLAYSGFTTHVNSSPHYNEYYKNADRLKTLTTLMLKEISKRKLLKVKGVRKDVVITDFVFDSYRRWFETRENYRGKVFNLSDDGAIIKGIPHLSIKAVAKMENSMQKKERIKPVEDFYLEKDVCLRFLYYLLEKVRLLKEDVKNGVEPMRLSARYSFLKNSILEAQALYRNDALLRSYLIILTGFFEKRIIRAINSMK